MWGNQVLLIIIGLSSGAVIASGFFSFIVGLGIISKFADRTQTADWVNRYEDLITIGGALGSILYIYRFAIPFAYILMPVIGMASGVFVGCWAMSIAEVINIFPVFMRRIKLVRYVKYIVASIALGKGVGMWLMFLLW